MNIRSWILLALTGWTIGFLPLQVAQAVSGDLYLDGSGLYLSSETILEGSPVRLYANVNNASTHDLKAIVRFYLGSQSTQVGSDQTVSVLANNSDIAFVDLYPPAGQHTVIARVFPWDPSLDIESNNVVSKTIWVASDFDRDQIADDVDPDDDNDGSNDTEDDFPLNAAEHLDSDADGIGNNEDTDDDNDDVPDSVDAFPLDATESLDTDGDGLGNNQDPDDDNDGLEDDAELQIGTDPLQSDTDTDGVLDGEDQFPLNADEAFDFDADGLGNNQDPDDDNDGIADSDDAFPQNHGPEIVLKTSFWKLSGIPVTFDLGMSTDPDGEIRAGYFTIDGIRTDNFTHTHAFPAGWQEVTVEVYDTLGEGRKQVWRVFIFPLWGVLLIFATLVVGWVGMRKHLKIN